VLAALIVLTLYWQAPPVSLSSFSDDGRFVNAAGNVCLLSVATITDDMTLNASFPVAVCFTAAGLQALASDPEWASWLAAIPPPVPIQ
jgi:hypothetical protein